jgi:hypothetical protein
LKNELKLLKVSNNEKINSLSSSTDNKIPNCSNSNSANYNLSQLMTEFSQRDNSSNKQNNNNSFDSFAKMLIFAKLAASS